MSRNPRGGPLLDLRSRQHDAVPSDIFSIFTWNHAVGSRQFSCSRIGTLRNTCRLPAELLDFTIFVSRRWWNVSGTAVYQESGGTLDFYNQITDDSNSAAAIQILGTVVFGSAAIGYRIDGGSLSGSLFTDGTVAPSTGDRSSSTTMKFLFGPPGGTIAPGMISDVFVISTNATAYTIVSAIVSTGTNSNTAQSFTTSSSSVPEPTTILPVGIIVATIIMRHQFGAGQRA